MQFSFSDDQIAFRDAVRDLLRGRCTTDHLRSAWTNPTGRIDGLWAQLTAQGLTLLPLPEADGGLGCGELDTVLIFEEAGRACVPEPLVEVVGVGLPLLVDAAEAGSAVARRLIAESAQGAMVLPALDGSGYALYGDAADTLLVMEGDRLMAFQQDQVALHAETSVDRSRRLFRVETTLGAGEVIAEGALAASLLRRAQNRGALANAAFQLGLGDTMIRLGVEHVAGREQFGKPIGSFQAVQHRMVNGWMGVEFARPVVYRAAYSMQHTLPDAETHVSMAKIYATEGAYRASREVLQCHGAIGYTTEYELHMWMKRSWAISKSWGDTRAHETRVEEAILG